MFYVYILRSETSGHYYIGSTNDIEQRLKQHNSGIVKPTKGTRPWRLMRTEVLATLAQARRREMQIKSWKNPSYMERVLELPQ
tara:strand:+ start:75 stop:323 length:249 start_codon:yes stop_codon:yes gene_type:complete